MLAGVTRKIVEKPDIEGGQPPADLTLRGAAGDYYRELRALAASFLRREGPCLTLNPTALVNEAWLRMASQRNRDITDRAHFMALAGRLMRRALVDYLRERRAAKRPQADQAVTLQTLPGEQNASTDLMDVHQALEELETLDARQASIVEMRLFAGFTVEEIAEALALSSKTVARDWAMAKAWLQIRLREGRD